MNEIKAFLASPARVFNALNWALLIGALTGLVFIDIPEYPGIKLLLLGEWLAMASLYVFFIWLPWKRGR